MYPSVSSAMPQGKRALHLTQQELQAPTKRPCVWQPRPEDGENSTAITRTQLQSTLPERVLQRRVYFLNPERTKFISLGYYPARNYDPCVEIGGLGRKKPVVLTTYYLSTLSQHLPKLFESVCANESYEHKEMSFRLQTVGRNNVCKLTYDQNSITFKLNELNYLLAHIATFENQLSRYSIAQNDVILYVINALDSDVYVEPRPHASTYVLYDVLYDELKAVM